LGSLEPNWCVSLFCVNSWAGIIFSRTWFPLRHGTKGNEGMLWLMMAIKSTCG
jgi:hypothetical protein